MIVLIVVGCILLLLLFLLLAPVSIRFSCRHEGIRLHLHYLFLRYDLSPDAIAKRAERKSKKAAEKEYQTQTQEADTKEDKLKGAKDTAKTVWSLLRASRRSLNLVRRNLVIYRLRADIRVGREDAHQTAIAYGMVSSAVAIGTSILGELFVLRPCRVHVSPDFTHDTIVYECSLRARIQPMILLIAGLRLALSYADVMKENKRARVKKKRKGGQVHESATSH